MKSQKLVKILGASGLAIMMSIGTLCGVLIAPVAGATASSNAGDLAARAQLGDSALTPEAKAELDANILAGGGLGLDPENDPIVATTDWGLDIYFHNAGESSWVNTSANGNVTTTALNGYNYFLGGTYGGVELKWVIIGYSTNTVTGPVAVPGTNANNIAPDSSPAGSAVSAEKPKQQVMIGSYKLSAYTNAVGNAEIPAGCVLCISEKNLLNGYFNQNTYSNDAGDGYRKGARWVYSDLRTTMSNLCNSGIAGFDTIRSKIQTVSLNTYSYRYKVSDGTQAIGKDTSSDKFFALANSTYGTNDAVHYNTSTYPQNYRLETYLGATYASYASKRISYTHNTTSAYYWWLRSGYSSGYNSAYGVDASGFVGYYDVANSNGVRPAFVLKL